MALFETAGTGASFTTSGSTYNTVNQLTGRGLGPVLFRGTVNEPAKVTLSANGGPAQLAKMTRDPASQNHGKIFTASLNLPAGQNTVQIVATDFGAGNGNQTTKNYSLTVNAVQDRSYSYDDNGNCLGYTYSGGSVTYDWDAEDRLVKITQTSTGNPTLTSEFSYDGFSRWVKIVEKSNGSVTSTKQFIWCGRRLCEERDAANNVTKRFYADGQINYLPSTLNLFYARDHLGSVREMTGGGGLVRYSYDPYGRRTKLSGTEEADFGFTGHYYHAPSGLHLALYRAYDADTGRWLNRDPIGEAGGLNLYDYVVNNPVSQLDPLGLESPVRRLTIGECLAACAEKQWLGFAIGFGGSGSGLPLISKGGKARIPGSSKGTSLASKYLSKWCPQRIPRSWAPTLRNPRARTIVLGRFLGRWVPYISAAILIGDIAQTSACTAECEGISVGPNEDAADYVNDR